MAGARLRGARDRSRAGRKPLDDLSGASPERVDENLSVGLCASTAQWHAERRARRPKTAKLITNERLRDYVVNKLGGPVRATGGERSGPEGPTWDGKHNCTGRTVSG